MSFLRECKEETFKQGQRFILNANVVKDSLLSLACHNTNLALLNFANVLVRRDYPTYENVKIVSGGPSGHEPAHGGYVGKGMLTAAIQGDVFISPSSKDVLRTLREITYKQKTAGTVIIIPSDVGTCLNFTVAAQKASNEGIRLKLVIVKDDVSHPSGQGLTGIVLVQKIAGALAESGSLMNQIFDYCEKVCNDLYTVMLTLKPCRSPKYETCICNCHFGPHDLVIGGGLRGENVGEKHNIGTIDAVCNLLIEELMTNPNKPLTLEPTVPVVLLINNLGNTSMLEQHLFVKCFIQMLQSMDIRISRFYCGHYMTSLDAAGFTVTILKLTNENCIDLLDAPTEAPSWQPSKMYEISPTFQDVIKSRIKDKRPSGPRGPSLSEEQSDTLMLILQFSCDALISCEKQLNVIDSEVGDGDTGTRIKYGVQEINLQIQAKTIDFTHPFNFFVKLSVIFEKAVAGTLGCLYSILFESIANAFFDVKDTEAVDFKMWLLAFNNAIQTLSWYFKIEPGGNTMFDPLYDFVTILNRQYNDKTNELELLDIALRAAEESVLKTKGVNRKYPDPGAHAVGIWMRAVYEGIKLRYG